MPIHHVVFLKFRKDAPREATERFIRELNRIPSFNPEVRNQKRPAGSQNGTHASTSS